MRAKDRETINPNATNLGKIPTPRYVVCKSLPLSDVKVHHSTAKGTRFYPVYVLAATMGLRRGELLGLRWSDVDFTKNILQVSQTVQRVSGRLIIDETKTEASDAVVPLPKITRAVLLEHQGHQATMRDEAGELWADHDLVFSTSIGTPIEPRSLNTHWEGVREQAGLPGVRLHDLRHTVVSLLLELGTPPHVVQAIARHANLEITMKIYAHTNLDTMREALDKIDWDAE